MGKDGIRLGWKERRANEAKRIEKVKAQLKCLISTSIHFYIPILTFLPLTILISNKPFYLVCYNVMGNNVFRDLRDTLLMPT